MSAQLELVMMSPEETNAPDDAQLVARSIDGDSLAFEELVLRKTNRVFGHCYRLIGNAEEARDIGQLVFVKLWENLTKYDPSFQFDTWLYRIVTNVTIDYVRGRKTRANAVNSTLRLVKTSVDAEQPVSFQRKEVERIFQDLASALSPKQKEVFVMREMDDIPSPEIARILGCRESTVRNHLFNARKLLRKGLEERYPEYARLWRDSHDVR